MKNRKYYYIWLSLISAICYLLIGYFTVRSNFTQLIILYTLTFAAFILLSKKASTESINSLLIVSIIFRLIFIIAIPNLSDDFYRFIWDGRLINHHINPYLILPSSLNSLALAQFNLADLYPYLNSPNYFTIYPPLNQLVFAASTYFFPHGLLGSVILIRVFLILADIGSIIFIRKILRKLALPASNVLFYALNPIVIIELAGNLHFEGLLIFFFLISLWFVIENKPIYSSLSLGFSIAVKLVPLIFLPLIVRKIGLKKSIIFCCITLSVFLASFIPFASTELFQNVFSSIDLYFQKFEFNASIYYLIRYIGYLIKGYNIIHVSGVVLSIVTALFIGLTAIFFKRKNNQQFFNKLLLISSGYLFMALVIHPWYVIIPLTLSVFTTYRFPVLWSYTCIFSYATYRAHPYQEVLWLTFLEYMLVGVFLVYELKSNGKSYQGPRREFDCLNKIKTNH